MRWLGRDAQPDKQSNHQGADANLAG